MNKYILLIAGVVALAVLAQGFLVEPPMTREELGKKLFFDPILSGDYTISCASCHKPEFAFADTVRFSEGVKGRTGNRNTPSAMNLHLQEKFFWDGRAASLEEQALAPIANPIEMDLPIDSAVQRLKSNALYKQYFSTVFGESPSAKNIGLAIAAFENNLETTGSPFDEWKFSDEQNAVSDAVKRGFVIFNNKGKCNKCHFGANHSTNEFKNIGLFDGTKLNDSGRYTVTRQAADIGKFKTPGLRNISLTAPYMHDGIFRTLEEVIEFYNDPKKLVPGGIGVDSVLSKPLDLTKEEKAELLEFLRALTDPPHKLTVDR